MANVASSRYELMGASNEFRPPPLDGFAFDAMDDKLFIFGGYNFTERSQTNRLYCFSLIDGWKEVLFANVGPCCRINAGMCCIQSKVFIFGGFSQESGVLGDLLVLDLKIDGRWKRLGNGPSPRSNCKLVAGEDDFLYVYGGLMHPSSDQKGTKVEQVSLTEKLVYLDDFWKYDTNSDSWSLVTSRGSNLPPKLADYSMTKVANTLILFGGRYSDASRSNNVYQFSLESQIWFHSSFIGIPPAARQCHSSVNASDKYLIIFGGQDNENWELDDLRLLDCENLTWLVPAINEFGEVPCPRFGHASSLLTDPDRGLRLVIFGGLAEVDPGSNLAQNILNDMYSLNLCEILLNCRVSEESYRNVSGDDTSLRKNTCDDCFDC